MGRDLAAWENGILESVSAARLDGAIAYVNVATEVSYSFQRPGGVHWSQVSGPMVEELFRAVRVPGGKRGGDVLMGGEASTFARDLRSADVALAVTEVHSYPAEGTNADLAEVVGQVRAGLPGVPVVIGEFGSALCAPGNDEALQADSLRRVLEQAGALGIDSVTNWGSWDYQDGACGGDGERRWGMGYSRDRPRAALGVVVGRQSAVPGGNFERGTSGFSVGGAGAEAAGRFSLAQGLGDAAQGAGYLRLRADAPGVYWTCSPSFPTPRPRVALSAYVRRGMVEQQRAEPDLARAPHQRLDMEERPIDRGRRVA